MVLLHSSIHIANPSFSNSPTLSPSPYLRKLIILTIRKNTTPLSPNNPANSPRIKVSARATPLFQHAPFVSMQTRANISLHLVPQNSLCFKGLSRNTNIYYHVLTYTCIYQNLCGVVKS